MHSPNPMFPTDTSHLASAVSPTSPTAWYLGHTPSLDRVNIDRNHVNTQNLHRRAHSDFSGALPQSSHVHGMQKVAMKPSDEPPSARGIAAPRRSSQSRIPVSTRPYSSTSDSGRSSQSSQPATRATQIKNVPGVNRHELSRSSPIGAASSPAVKTNTRQQSSATSPKRKPQTPLQVKSSRRRDGSIQQAEKSPSLRANIIAPPPKISPPLRSSRPRQPVSAASTAASRAKMVEKIGAMQISSIPRPTARRRPPELENIDIAGRRQRITQAFNRTMEEDKRKTQLSERSSQNMTPRAEVLEGHASDNTPAIIVNEPIQESADEDVFVTPAEAHLELHQPLRLQTIAHPPMDDDSPTLGKPDSSPFDTLRGPPRQLEREPRSAITTATDVTDFDSDAQPEYEYPTVLSHVMQMRSSSPATSRSFERSDSPDALSERADQESIQIMLRNTAYYDDEDDEDVPATHNVLEGLNGQAMYNGVAREENNRSSWTSSMGDRLSVDEKSSASLSYDGDKGQSASLPERNDDVRREKWSPSSFASPETTYSTTDDTAFNVVNVAEHKVEPTPSQSRHYHASLAGRDDWTTYSPAVDDWTTYENEDFAPSVPPKDSESTLRPDAISSGSEGLGLSIRGHNSTFSLQSRSPPPRPPSHSPPPIPPLAAIDRATAPGVSPSIYDSEPPSSTFRSSVVSPKIPRRVTSISQIENKQQAEQRGPSVGIKPPTPSISEDRPSFDQPSINSSISKRSSPTPEQRRLRKRRHVIKELIDTESTFGRDMLVIVDIYKETSSSCKLLTPEDVKILFGNSDQVASFSTIFLDKLKQGSKSVYTMPKSERFQRKWDEHPAARASSAGTGLTAATDDQSSIHGLEILDADADRQTNIGKVFRSCMAEMEEVYTQYLKNHNAANRKLQSLQHQHDVEIWLKECYHWANDLTTAWNLDSLLVKPVQRILKYPLLLQSLIESTPEDHPDHNSLVEALQELTRVSMEINEKTKQTDLVNQVLNRKRKDSDVRTGLSKAFGRHTEKLKQHVGMSEMVEDSGYNELKERYAENFGQLVVVSSDIRKYKGAVTKWVERLSDLAAAADSWVDVHQGPWPEYESKLRQFAMTVREIASIGLPDHLAAVQKSVLDPMIQGAKMLESLQKDPKGLFQKRDKKLIDYARFRNMKDRGEKLDRKTVERMEQWEALNREAKERMTKLLDLTSILATRCLRSFVQIHLDWLDIWKRKLPPTMNVTVTETAQIEREWQQDFDFHEATALSMSICNGSLLAEAVNMVNFLSPSTTMNGDDSPRQPSWMSGNKRSISLNSEGSPALATGQSHRYSGSFNFPPILDDNSDRIMPPFANGRLRATSLASGPGVGPPDITNRVTSLSGQTTANSTRPSTSTGRPGEPSVQFPRLSFDPPSPFMGPNRTTPPSARPESSSTFFSTTAGPSNAMPSPASQPAAVFSSAMPMSDSPMTNEFPFEEVRDYEVLFAVASIYEFNIDRARREAGFPYLTYVAGEVFDVIGEKGELWLARNQDDPQQQIGWIWHKHFAKLEQ